MTSPAPLPQARRGHSLAERRAASLLELLARNYAPYVRAPLLDELAAAYDRMAELHTAAFGPDQIDGEPGRDAAAALASSGWLVRLVAITEHALAGDSLLPLDTAAAIAAATTAEQFHILGRLCAERDRAARAEFIMELRALSVEHVGERAATVLTSLAEAEQTAAGRRRPRLTWRDVRADVSWAAGAVTNLLVALAAGIWCVGFLSRPTTEAAVRVAVVTIAVFATLAAIDSRLNAWLARRRCVVCGSAANRRGRLRFDRLHPVYRSVHVDCQRWLPPGTPDSHCPYGDCHHNHPEISPRGGNGVSTTDGVTS
jgi:hypothetical protein